MGITVSGVAQTQTSEKPLKVETIEKLIAIKAPSLVHLIRKRGIDFPLDENTLLRLKKLGASKAVIDALREIQAPRIDREKRVSILVADFKPVSVQDRPVTEILIEQLRNATKEYPDISIQSLGEPITAQLGEDYAKKKGKERGADIVIWGWYSGAEEKILVNIHFEVLRGPSNLSLSQNMKTFEIPISDFKGFNLQIQTPLSSQMSYLTLLTLGLARLEAQDFDGATAAFTQALSLPSVPDTMVAPADIYFYRALSHFAKSYIQLADEADLAIADLDRAIQIDPTYTEARLMLGTAYCQKGSYEKAIEILDQAVALTPDDVLLLLQRGETYTAMGVPAFASRDCNRALELLARNDEGDPATFFLRWQGHFCKQDFVSAISDATKAISIQKDRESLSFLLLLRATSYFISNQSEKAINDATQALELKPDLLPTYQIRAAAYADLEKFAAALADANYLVQLSPTNVLAYFIRAEVYRAKFDLKQSEADYTRALALDADFGAAYVGRGRVHQVLTEYESAIADFDKALTTKKPDPEGLLYRGLAYESMKQMDKALSDFSQYISLFPTDENGYSFRANAYDSKGEPDKATEDYSKAIELRTDDADLFSRRGAIYEKQGKLEKAIKDYTRAIDLSPTSKNYCDRGLAYLNSEDRERALKDFNSAIKSDPKYSGAWMYRGLLFWAKGESDRAISDFTAALQLRPNWDAALLFRGRAYAQKGDRVRALSDLERCLRVTTYDSNRKQAQDEIVKLQPKRTPAPVKSKLAPGSTLH